MSRKSRASGFPAGPDAATPVGIRIIAKIIRMKPVKKTWLIDPELVRKARKVSGTRTETETVTLALRELLVRNEIDRAFRRHGPVLAGVEAVFPDSVSTQR